jgi:aspartate aminotransferase
MERIMSLIAKRLNTIKPSPTLAVTSKATELKARGIDVISLGAGEPDFDTPDTIKHAAIEAIHSGQTKYTAVDGVAALKQAICDKFLRDNQLQYKPSQITVGAGAKQVLYNALMASVDPGDEVIILAPYWVSYVDIAALAGGVPVCVTCGIEQHFKMTPAQLEAAITPRTKWLILNSPSNPTGAVYSREEMKGLTDVLLKHPHVYVLSDDIYEHLVFDHLEFVTPAQVEPKLYNRTLTVNGFSKAYAMTGWRLGYAGGPEVLIQAIATIQSQSTSNPSSLSQAAGIEALNGRQDFLPVWRQAFISRRDLVVEALNKIEGIHCPMPQGAFYVFVDCRGLLGKCTQAGTVLNDCNAIATFFLEHARVAVVPGIAFGMEGFIRISYASSEALLAEACRRVHEACRTLV